jgi:hypothetical protein
VVVIADLQANDAGAVYREAAADRTLRAVDVLIELGRLLDQLAVRGVHDQVSLSVELHAGRAGECELDHACIGAGVDDPVVFERAGVRMEREVDAGIDIGHLDAAVARHTRSGIGEIAGVGVGDAELLVELHDRRIGICTERSDLQNVAAADELDRAAILHHVKCVVPIRGGECDRAVGLPPAASGLCGATTAEDAEGPCAGKGGCGSIWVGWPLTCPPTAGAAGVLAAGWSSGVAVAALAKSSNRN